MVRCNDNTVLGVSCLLEKLPDKIRAYQVNMADVDQSISRFTPWEGNLQSRVEPTQWLRWPARAAVLESAEWAVIGNPLRTSVSHRTVLVSPGVLK